MRKVICITIALCLILASFSNVFAVATDWDTTDSANLSSIKTSLTSSTGTVVQVLGNIANRLIYNNLSLAQIAQNIDNALHWSSGGTNRSIAYWVWNANSWLSDIASNTSDFTNGLMYTDGNGAQWPWLMDVVNNLDFLRQSLTNYYSSQTTFTQAMRRANGHQNFFSSSGQWVRNIFDSNGDLTSETFLWQNGTPLGNIFGSLRGIGDSTAYGFNKLLGQMNAYPVYDDPSDYTSRYFNGISFADVALDQLGSIDMFIARLGYVLASDERIEAQESAAANEEAVVDNFIDSSGAGSASPSDIGSLSDLSSGYKDNFGSSASVTGIFDIFDSNNFGWFSQETANQLDTSSSTRAKSGSSFETPLLDQRINDIYDALGVKP